jgi:Fur family ferric uptake transcriptional regulator
MTGVGEHRRTHQTQQRRAVLRALTQVPGFISAQELHARLRHAGNMVALATVYRALRVLADAGQIDATRAASGERLFRYCAEPGCAYFLVCDRCGVHISLDACPVEEWAAVVAAQHGFADISLVVEITGRCPACGTVQL